MTSCACKRGLDRLAFLLGLPWESSALPARAGIEPPLCPQLVAKIKGIDHDQEKNPQARQAQAD